jgi:hypothetical protein
MEGLYYPTKPSTLNKIWTKASEQEGLTASGRDGQDKETEEVVKKAMGWLERTF